MTVSSTLSQQTFNCDGTTRVFTLPFRVLAETEVVGFRITVADNSSATLTNGVDFTVSGVGAANAVVTTTTAYSSLYQVKFRRSTARLQLVDYRDNDPFPAESHEQALDRLTHIAQELDGVASRAIVFPEPETGATLPPASSRALTDLGFDAAGALTLFDRTADGGVVGTTFATTLITATAGQTVLTVPAYTPGTSAVSVFADGQLLTPDVDFTETASGTITLAVGALASQEFVVRTGRTVTSGLESSQVGHVTPGGVSRTLYAIESERINVKNYGATGDGTADDTAAIQAAFDAAAASLLNHKRVFIPAGVYSVSTLYVPVGIAVEGETFIEGSDRAGSRLVQRSAGDVIRFTPIDNGGKLYWNGSIRRLAIFGTASLASGWGISFRNSAGATVSMQDLSLLEDLIIRRCPSGGVEVPNSGLPITFNRMKLLFNNGPGIHITSVTSNQHQAVNLTDISGDGNNGGLIKLTGLDANGNVNIVNLKSERRLNTDYSSADYQENAIVCETCDKTPINIIGATHISSVPDGAFFKKPGSLIKLTDAYFPAITWLGVGIRVRGTDTGTDPSIIEYSTTIAIPRTTSSGRFGNVSWSHVTQAGEHKWTLGSVSSYQADSGEDNSLQIAGTTPALSLYETDASANTKAWLPAVASGGNLTQRAVDDAGTSTIWRTTFRSAGVATKDVWAVPIGVPSYTVATLPAASLGSALLVYVSDESGGATMAFSDGSNWRRVQDRAVVS